MPSDKPRKNHYIPEMILKRFCDQKETLWVNNGSKVYKANIRDTFEERDLTATRNMIPSTKDHNYTVELSYEHEDALQKIEDKAAPAIQQIIDATSRGQCPNLSPNLREALQYLFITIVQRNPEAQAELWPSPSHEDVFYKSLQKGLQEQGVMLSDKQDLRQFDVIAEAAKDTEHNTKAKFSAGNHHILQKQAASFVRSTGLNIAVIPFPTKSFVIGSRGLAIIEDSKYEDLMRTIWLPLAPHIAIRPTSEPDIVTILYFNNSQDAVQRIDAINHAMAARSWAIAGASKGLVQSINPGRLRQLHH